MCQPLPKANKMPVSGFEYNTRPYSSFRATRGSCALQHHATTTANSYLQHQPQHQQHQHLHHNCSKISINGSGNPLQTSSSATSIAIRNSSNHSNNNTSNSGGGGGGLTSNFSRQQSMRSSFYGTRYNQKIAGDSGCGLNGGSTRNCSAANINSTTTVSVKPLTPKLVKRIESTCTQQHHTKPRAPNPPNQQTHHCNGTSGTGTTTTTTTTTSVNGVHSTPNTAQKQYLRTRNLPPTPPQRKSSNFDRFHQTNLSIRQKTNPTSVANATANSHIRRSSAISSSNDSQESLIPKATGAASSASSQKRAYANTVSKVAKENQPKDNTTNGSHNGPPKSIKSYPAPLPPQSSFRRKCKEEPGRITSSVSASPNLNQRRFISSVGINSFNATCNAKALPTAARRTYTSANNGSSVVAPSTPTSVRNKTYANNSNSTPTASISSFGRQKNFTNRVNSGLLHKTGSTGSNSSSNQSSGSQGSPKSKKAFSTKFPQGLPFEDEFYRRNRSYSQSSSSNYSFYSSNGGGGGGAGSATTPQTPRDYDVEEEDEFQRKPSTEEPLYVDFTKVMHHHRPQDYNKQQQLQQQHHKSQHHHTTIVNGSGSSPQTTWIGVVGGSSSSIKQPSTTNYDSSLLNSPHSQRRCSHHSSSLLYTGSSSNNSSSNNNTNNSTETLNNTATTKTNTSSARSRTKYSQCINDYLYASDGKLSTTTTSDSRKSLLYSSKHLDPYHQADNGYYTHASPDSSPPPPPASGPPTGPLPRTDIYKAVSSWAPKCSHPTKVMIPADPNNNKNDRYHSSHHHHHHHQYDGGAVVDKYYVEPVMVDKSDDILESTNSEYR